MKNDYQGIIYTLNSESALRELAEENECWYLDCCTPLCDESGYLPDKYAGWDGSPHLATSGYGDWADVIRTYYA